VEPKFLTYDRVIRIHIMQLELFGGAQGIRDPGLLDSALAMPRAGFGGHYLHEDLFEMAGAYLFHIAMNHPFIDGNKRTGFAAAHVFLKVNGIDLTFTVDQAYDLVIGVCEGTVTKGALAAALREHALPLEGQQDGS
jgi:death-on-curing protein